VKAIQDTGNDTILFDKGNDMTNSNMQQNGFHLCAGTMQRYDAMGFQMTFANGWTISVQWAEHNYAQRSDRTDPVQSTTAECAVFDANGDWFPLTVGDNVQGWMTPDMVAELMTRVAGFEAGNDILDECDTVLE